MDTTERLLKLKIKGYCVVELCTHLSHLTSETESVSKVDRQPIPCPRLNAEVVSK